MLGSGAREFEFSMVSKCRVSSISMTSVLSYVLFRPSLFQARALAQARDPNAESTTFHVCFPRKHGQIPLPVVIDRCPLKPTRENDNCSFQQNASNSAGLLL